MKSKCIGLICGILSAAAAFAASGGATGVGGGGDVCENRIKVIRDDLESWIYGGGHLELTLPKGTTRGHYAKAMLQEIARAKIRCVGPKDKGYPVKVGNTPKVCRFDKISTQSWITCDFLKFQAVSEDEQYVLIHHEFAGLAEMENPADDDSIYEISNQITGYLMEQVVKKLAVKSSSYVNEPGVPLVDEVLFRSLRMRYSGEFHGNETGKLRGQVLENGTVLVSAGGKLAEFSFSNLPKGAEEIQYIPDTASERWTNYFNRAGNSIRCGIVSFDLRKNPSPGAVCRFTVDAQGNVSSFGDRAGGDLPDDYETQLKSLANSLRFSIQSKSYPNFLDFLWMGTGQIGNSTGTAEAYRPGGFEIRSPSEKSFIFYIDGDLASIIYNALAVKPVAKPWNNSSTASPDFKSGNSIWCFKTPNDLNPSEDNARCGITFSFEGSALPVHFNGGS